MKQTYSGFEAKKSVAYEQLPPPGLYIAEIQAVRLEPSYDKTREQIACMIEIIEGEYAGQYHKVYENKRERYSDAKYPGVFTLIPPIEGDEPWRQKSFEGNLWCVEQSNPGYHWDWDEKKLKGKKIGINVRKNLYTYNNKDYEKTEIAKFEAIEDIRSGEAKVAKERDQRKKHDDSEDQQTMTDVTDEVEVPF